MVGLEFFTFYLLLEMVQMFLRVMQAVFSFVHAVLGCVKTVLLKIK